MNLGITVAPQPLPGKTQPTSKPQIDWVGRDLVSADVEAGVGGKQVRSTYAYQAMGLGELKNGLTAIGQTDIRAFSPLAAASFVDAVEAASQIAARHPMGLNVDKKDATETTASLAVALLQSADGSWFTTSLTRPGNLGSLTVDTGRANVTIHDVTQLHPAVKAVVGAHSWVNFTPDAIEPRLAG
jgi:hypothetical protein